MRKSIVLRVMFGVFEDFKIQGLNLDEEFISNKEATFFLQATTHDMAPLILPGETLIVDRALNHLYSGRICIISYQEKLICRRVLLEQSCTLLVPSNPKSSTIKIFSEEDFEIWGVVTTRIGKIS